MRRVFVDTSALLALLDRADPRHESTRNAFRDLADDDLVTHGYVIAESLAVARRRFGVEGAIALLDDLLPAMTLLAVEPAWHVEAQRRYRASLPSSVSFVDQVSFELMREMGIKVAFTVDRDFSAAGVEVIPAADG